MAKKKTVDVDIIIQTRATVEVDYVDENDITENLYDLAENYLTIESKHDNLTIETTKIKDIE